MDWMGIACAEAQDLQLADFTSKEVGEHWSYEGSLEVEDRVVDLSLYRENTAEAFVKGQLAVRRTSVLTTSEVEIRSVTFEKIASDGLIRLREEIEAPKEEYTINFEPPLNLLPATASVGDSFDKEFSFTKSNGAQGTVRLVYDVAEIETVETPLGNYEAVKVDTTRNLMQEGGGQEQLEVSEFSTAWYARRIGLIKGQA